MMGIREDPGDRWTGVEETIMGSENRSGRKVGVVGPVEGGSCGVWVLWSNVD